MTNLIFFKINKKKSEPNQDPVYLTANQEKVQLFNHYPRRAEGVKFGNFLPSICPLDFPTSNCRYKRCMFRNLTKLPLHSPHHFNKIIFLHESSCHDYLIRNDTVRVDLTERHERDPPSTGPQHQATPHAGPPYAPWILTLHLTPSCRTGVDRGILEHQGFSTGLNFQFSRIEKSVHENFQILSVYQSYLIRLYSIIS